MLSLLGIENDSEEAKYIQSNIKITNFRDLESFAFKSYDIFVALRKKRDNFKDWNDMGLFDDCLYNDYAYKELPSVKSFTDKCQGKIKESIEEFVQLGLVKKD